MNFDIENFLPYKLSLTTNTVSEKLSEIYISDDLTRTQWRVMAVIGKGAITAGEISQKTMMDKATISRAVKKLITRDIIEKHTNQDDGRCSPLHLTSKGLSIFAKITPKAIAVEKQIVQNFSKQDLKTLERLLNILLTK